MKQSFRHWISAKAKLFALSRHSREGGNDGLKKKRLRRLAALAVLIAAYPAFVFTTVYAHWFAVDLPGGRNGPADAYRHALASATVAYTATPRWVDWVTAIMERDGSGNASRSMDAHNNRIGAAIGARAENWNEMQTAVLTAVRDGRIDTAEQDRITWLPPERWQNRLY